MPADPAPGRRRRSFRCVFALGGRLQTGGLGLTLGPRLDDGALKLGVADLETVLCRKAYRQGLVCGAAADGEAIPLRRRQLQGGKYAYLAVGPE